MMECNVCLDTHVVGTINGYEPCRACMRSIGYDIEKDPDSIYKELK